MCCFGEENIARPLVGEWRSVFMDFIKFLWIENIGVLLQEKERKKVIKR